MSRRILALFLPALMALALLGPLLTTRAGQTITVNSTADAQDATPGDGVCATASGNGICTLRAAFMETNALSGADTIILPSGVYTLTLGWMDDDSAEWGDLDVLGTLTLVGAGAETTIIDGNKTYRIIDLPTGGSNLTVSGVTLRNGRGTGSANPSGGAIRHLGRLVVRESTISGNSAPEGGGIGGFGGVSLTVIDSTISNNSAITGGGLYVGTPALILNTRIEGNSAYQGGAIANAGSLTLSRSTVSANSTTGMNGTLDNYNVLHLLNSTVSGNSAKAGGAVANARFLTISSSTIAFNTASEQGGGIYNYSAYNNGSSYFKDSILAGNSAPPGKGADCAGPRHYSQGYNLVQNVADCVVEGDLRGTLLGVDPRLGPLQDNGGPTLTHALLADSPAIDAANPTGPTDAAGTVVTEDQRDALRPRDGDGDGRVFWDMGAIEFGAAPPALDAPGAGKASKEAAGPFALERDAGGVAPAAPDAPAASPLLVTTLLDDETGAPIDYARGQLTLYRAEPDAGYTWDATERFQWIDAKALGVDSGVMSNDHMYAGPLGLGFPFSYYDAPVEAVYINADGALSIGAPIEDLFYMSWPVTPLPTPGRPDHVIAPYWADMWPHRFQAYPGAGIYYYRGGEAPNRYFVVEWYRVIADDSAPGISDLTFEVILHENGDIVMQYLNLYVPNQLTPSIGLEDAQGLRGLQYRYGGPAPKNQSAIRFRPSQEPGLAFLQTLPFSADAHGVFTATLSSAISGTVYLELGDVNAYAHQFYDRRERGAPPDTLVLAPGRTDVTARLVPATTLVTTLLDATSEQVISNTAGVVSVFANGGFVERQRFKTTDKGIFVVTLSRPVSGTVQLEYSEVEGYARQFHDGRSSLAQADGQPLRTWTNLFTSRLARAPRLVNQLVDDRTGASLAGTSGSLLLYAGDELIERRGFTTDASGFFSTTLSVYLDRPLRLEYVVAGYPRQSYDRSPRASSATEVSFAPGTRTLTTRLLSARLRNTLLDDLTGQPLRNTSGSLTIYVGAARLETRGFTTDATGTYTVTLSSVLSDSVRLEYASIAGYPSQFYDRALTAGGATEVAIAAGDNALTTRLSPLPRLGGHLVDDVDGAPLAYTPGTLGVYSGTLLLETRAFTTDATGAYSVTIQQGLPMSVTLEFALKDYPRQFYDRALTRDQATPRALAPGYNSLDVRLTPYTMLVSRLIDDNTSLPLGQIRGSLAVYSGTLQLAQRSFITDPSGVFTTTFNFDTLSGVKLRYQVGGYVQQFYDRSLTLEEATPLTFGQGKTTLDVRLGGVTLVHRLVDSVTGAPLANQNGSGRTISSAGQSGAASWSFTTDSQGVYTTTLSGLVSEPIFLRMSLKGYPVQYHSLASTTAQAQSLAFQFGLNYVTTPIYEFTTLVHTLVDGQTGQPVANVSGSVAIYSGTLQLANRAFQTDGSGLFVATLSAHISQTVTLRYQVDGFPLQYYSQRLTLEEADPVLLRPGVNQLSVVLRRERYVIWLPQAVLTRE